LTDQPNGGKTAIAGFFNVLPLGAKKPARLRQESTIRYYLEYQVLKTPTISKQLRWSLKLATE